MPLLLLRPCCTMLSYFHPYSFQPPNARVNHAVLSQSFTPFNGEL
ncbi:hypothetical protein E2C01_046683 [Portunus trituberculatus]|uniref:Uncharacterized protein n=1 Tax=Portunus trituberculatus TaxID=210409 RepID=A0A5B7G5Q6_PORTR|nr:hypothetical protein [Portunus trituberculatus]